MSFQDLKQRVKINDVAEYLGYTFNPSAGKRYLEYRLMNGNSKVDEIVIYQQLFTDFFFKEWMGTREMSLTLFSIGCTCFPITKERNMRR